MQKRFSLLILFLLASLSLQAATKFASPTGSASNNGNEEAQAWSLEYALGLSSPLAPGDSLILIDGIYEGNFTSYLNGANENPIIVISQNDGKAIIDVSKNRTTGTGLIVRGSYTWFIGLKITSSSTIRNSDASNGFAEILYESGVTVFGDNIKIINCWIYDLVGGGVELWRNGFNNEVYGSVVFNNGSQGTERGTGHGFYIQHADPSQPKIIENNIVFQNASQGINLYTTNPENKGINVIRNVSFNTGVNATVNLLAHRPPHNLTVGSANNISSEVEIRENVFYRDLQGSRLSPNEVSNVSLGRTYAPNKNISFTNNSVFGGGNQIEIQPLEGLELKSNRLYNVHGNFYAFLGDKTSFPGADWNSNFLYNITNKDKPFNGLDFLNWKNDFGFDLNSESKSFPTQPQEILITQNKYEPAKFYVTIVSLNDAAIAVVDFSEFADFKGSKYEIIDFQNPFDSDQRVSGTFGGSTIQFPMNWTKSLQPKGNMPFPVVHTDLTFGTFLLKFEELEALENPTLKENIKLYLDEDGQVQVELIDLIESYGAYLPEEFTLSQNEFSCSDIPEATIEITAKNDPGDQEWFETTKISVLDTISPTFSFSNANLAFDLVIGSVSLDGPDFAIWDPADNCSDGLTLEFDKYEITCADIDEESGQVQVPIKITVRDGYNNSTSGNAFVNLNIIESKKVSLENTVNLYPGQNAEIKLGDELGYEVLEWQKYGVEIPGESSKTLEVSEEGVYRAKLRLESGCITYSQFIEVRLQDLPYPPVKENVELPLNENGIAELSKDKVFQSTISSDLIVTLSKSLFNCEDLGENTVLITIKDSEGNEWEESVLVFVQDITAPKLTLKEYSGTLDVTSFNSFELKREHIISDFSDNCEDGLEIDYSPKTIGCEDLNTPIKVEVSVKDQSGNTASSFTYVTIEKVESNKISLVGPNSGTIGSDVKLELGSEFSYQVLGWYKGEMLLSSSDSKVLTITESGVYKAKILPNNGCAVFSTIKEIIFSEGPDPDEKPYPAVNDKIELALNGDGVVELSKDKVFQGTISSDLIVTFSKSVFNCEDLGENSVSVTIKDSEGNEWEEQVLVLLQDITKPILETKNIEVEFDLTKSEIALIAEDFVELLSDNCGVKEFTINKSSVNCEAVGKEIQVELRAVDYSGNVTEKTATVLVKALVSKPVNINGPEDFCVGENKEISLTSEAAFEVVRWRRNGIEIEGQNGKILSIEEGGVYHAVIRYEGGCLFETEKIEIKTFEKPTGEIVEDGNILKAPEGYQYQWFRNGDLLPEETERTISLNQMGVYSVELTNDAGCKSVLPGIEVTISGIIGGKILSQELKIYPNPVQSEVIIESTGDLEFEKNSWQIYDMNGKNVNLSIKVQYQSPVKIGFDVTSLSNGTYLIIVKSTESKMFLGKIMKVK